ncbi:uncharacterized protein [Hetaerina americana]|uniref:uncharacterized protein isoform X2 n=1 Tax=Hetaerina americana TaxID=62018 RepID=UPI003A7F3A94
MDTEDREEILDNEFAEELDLFDLLDAIDYVYRCIDNNQKWNEIEEHMTYFKYALKEKAKDHDQYHGNYGNWWNKLAIVHCRRPHQKTFVTAIWDLIIAVEQAFLPSDTSVDSDMRIILDEVVSTVEECGLGARSLPLEYLVHELETCCWSMSANPETVQAVLLRLDLPFKKLYSIYRKIDLFDEDDSKELQCHFLRANASLIQSFIRKYQSMEVNERESVLQQCKSDVHNNLRKMLKYIDEYPDKLIQRYAKLKGTLENFRT